MMKKYRGFKRREKGTHLSSFYLHTGPPHSYKDKHIEIDLYIATNTFPPVAVLRLVNSIEGSLTKSYEILQHQIWFDLFL